ncbi:hypothetical protein POSPLADRAFT_1043166 [Postia placenta MAD-698-R-SB12]|uniref:Uncharacterized protein n=1 Tax=Postia placenta MAD-698-R-SB12 TaxID=670580 RepID=A0A1X6NHA3_9APHY|nr:hypothetical protein POSPLADRAFT_1043166 [Postia placenta MAD-698-R-SB12]OSX68001.1 hypothetical protein POSPLADRAFT_1043166 [Postia placenta MAD-698-R-SB12]
MKFATPLSALICVLPLLAGVVVAKPVARPQDITQGVTINGSAGTVSVTEGVTTGDSSSGSSAAAASSTANSTDLQSSLTLDPSLVATGFEQNGQNAPSAEAGQVPSLTSSNNFINFCATVSNLPLTNGLQIKSGSCNPAPMGVIAATTNMPASKFIFPANGATIPANKNFTIQMAIENLETGNFVNPDTNFFAAPQQVNSAGDIVGHSHVVIQALQSLNQTTVLNPSVFAFFKGLNDPAVNGVLSQVVSGGLPAGAYRLASINTAANHQPALVAVAQHGALDDIHRCRQCMTNEPAMRVKFASI